MRPFTPPWYPVTLELEIFMYLYVLLGKEGRLDGRREGVRREEGRSEGVRKEGRKEERKEGGREGGRREGGMLKKLKNKEGRKVGWMDGRKE